MGVRLGGVGEEAGRLDDQVDTQLRPRQIGGIALGENLDRPSGADGLTAVLQRVDDEPVLDDLDLAAELAVHRVVLEQVREGLGVGEVVDRHDFDRRVVFHGTEHQTTDAPETVDADSDSQARSLLE